MRKRPQRHAACCCTFDAPTGDRVNAGIHVDGHTITAEHPEQIPEEMQRRGRQCRPIAADERCQPVGDFIRAGRRSERGRCAKCELLPRAQRPACVPQSQVKRRRKVEH